MEIAKLPTLDGWRAVAIAMVLFCHVRLPGEFLAGASPYGALGVHVFFAISGFLITYRLIEEADGAGSISLRQFYIRRAFRILPPALVYLAAISVLGIVLRWIPTGRGQIAAAALFYRNYLVEPAARSWYTGHYWSLSVEEHFYILWPVILVGLGLSRARWVAPLLAASVAVWRGLDSTFGWVASIHPEWRDLVTRTDYRFDGLLWGCAAALLWHSRSVRDFINRRLSLGWAGVAVLIMGVMIWREFPGYQAIFALLAPVPILYTVAHPGSWLGRFLERRPIVWLGRISYSVYLWQMLFLPAYGIPVSLPWVQTFPLNLVFTLAAATASYYLLEQPVRGFGRRLATRLPARVRVIRASAPA